VGDDLRTVFDRKQEDMRTALDELLPGSRLKPWPDGLLKVSTESWQTQGDEAEAKVILKS
jgi:hypothetical protein